MLLPPTKIRTQTIQRKGKCILKPQLQAKEERSAPKFQLQTTCTETANILKFTEDTIYQTLHCFQESYNYSYV